MFECHGKDSVLKVFLADMCKNNIDKLNSCLKKVNTLKPQLSSPLFTSSALSKLISYPPAFRGIDVSNSKHTFNYPNTELSTQTECLPPGSDNQGFNVHVFLLQVRVISTSPSDSQKVN